MDGRPPLVLGGDTLTLKDSGGKRIDNLVRAMQDCEHPTKLEGEAG